MDYINNGHNSNLSRRLLPRDLKDPVTAGSRLTHWIAYSVAQFHKWIWLPLGYWKLFQCIVYPTHFKLKNHEFHVAPRYDSYQRPAAARRIFPASKRWRELWTSILDHGVPIPGHTILKYTNSVYTSWSGQFLIVQQKDFWWLKPFWSSSCSILTVEHALVSEVHVFNFWDSWRDSLPDIAPPIVFTWAKQLIPHSTCNICWWRGWWKILQ